MIECSKTVQDVVLFQLPNPKCCQCGCSAETSGCAHCKFYLCAVCRRYDCWTSSQTEFVRSGSLWAGTSLTFEVTFFETVLPGEWDQCEVAPRQFYSCNAGILLHSLGPFADKLKTLDSHLAVEPIPERGHSLDLHWKQVLDRMRARPMAKPVSEAWPQTVSM